VRVFGPLACLALSALVTSIPLAAPESCVLAERDPDSSADEGVPAPPVEADATDVFGGCTCCGKTILPLLPDCSGDIAFAMSAGDCPKDCTGSTAYALCEGVCYSDCACDLPEGFTLVDGGS
jgi:hypothetical protein